ncbi:MAG: hypothetical protein IKR36_03990, partial [Clostridia bacterium]|nr:hypothetical protein [Clostridia bacterium]
MRTSPAEWSRRIYEQSRRMDSRRYQSYGNKSKMSIYQLTDPFSLFYYKFIKNNGKTDKAFWQF